MTRNADGLVKFRSSLLSHFKCFMLNNMIVNGKCAEQIRHLATFSPAAFVSWTFSPIVRGATTCGISVDWLLSTQTVNLESSRLFGSSFP